MTIDNSLPISDALLSAVVLSTCAECGVEAPENRMTRSPLTRADYCGVCLTRAVMTNELGALNLAYYLGHPTPEPKPIARFQTSCEHCGKPLFADDGRRVFALCDYCAAQGD